MIVLLCFVDPGTRFYGLKLLCFQRRLFINPGFVDGFLGEVTVLVRLDFTTAQSRTQPATEAILFMKNIRARGTVKAVNCLFNQGLRAIANSMTHVNTQRLLSGSRLCKPGIKATIILDGFQ